MGKVWDNLKLRHEHKCGDQGRILWNWVMLVVLVYRMKMSVSGTEPEGRGVR